jgi:hypothetical protein
MPDALDGARLEHLPEALGLSDKDRALFDKVVANYRDAQTAARFDDPHKIDVLLPAAFRFDSVANDFIPVHTPELLAVLRMRDEVLRKLLAIEGDFDKSIDQLCPANGRTAWRTLRIERATELYGHPARLPAANVNMLTLLPKVGLEEAELVSLEPFFDRYARDYLEALRLRDWRLHEIEREVAETYVALGPEWRAGRNENEAIAVDRDLAKLEVSQTLADSALRTLNDKAIASLRPQLTPASWRKIVDAYHRVVHPELYEDERTFRMLTEEMVGLSSLDPATIGGVVDALAQLEDKLRPLGQQAADLADGIITADSLLASDAAGARIPLQSKLQSVLEKRRRAVRESTQLLRGMLGSQEPSFALKLEDSLQTLAALDRAGRFLREALDARAQEFAVVQAMRDAPPEADKDATRGIGAPEPQTQPAGSPENGEVQPNPTTPPSDQMPREPRNGRGSRGR